MTKYSSLVAAALCGEIGPKSDPWLLRKIEGAMDALHQQQMQTIVDTLNQALALDPKAISELMECNVDCNQAICDHPTIQVGEKYEGRGFLLRPIGLINGILEPITGQWIAMVQRDDADSTLLRFEVYNPAATRAADPTPQ